MEEKLKKNENASKFYVTPLISDGAVLQRNETIKVWGGGSIGAGVTGRLIKEKGTEENKACYERETCVAEDETWHLEFDALPAGGPYRLVLTSEEETLEYADIYMGDVWVLAGQSNMQLPMERVKYRYTREYREGSSPLIRQFIVPIGWNFNQPAKHLSSGKWMKAVPEYTPQFSAVGFFFAQKLREKYQVPVGLILTAVGGTPVEAWMSRETLQDFPEKLKAAEKCQEANYIKDIQEKDMVRMSVWRKKLDEEDRGIKEGWIEKKADGLWEKMNLSDEDKKRVVFALPGSVWLKKYVEISPDRANKPVRLSLGTITDADYTYVNGKLVGGITYQYPPREYELAGLPSGRNLITVRVIVERGHGGFTVGKKQELTWEDGTKLDISQGWEYQRGATMKPLEYQTFFERKPLGMYQAMMAPLHDLPIKGVCWYQGEMNSDEPEPYKVYFEKMISDWRSKWHKKDLPVLFVQLPDYDLEDGGNWVAFRNMQRELVRLPHTSMVVTIDCGEVNDLHPTKKKPVGERLAMAAYEEAYGEEGNWLSPVFTFAECRKNDIVLHFDHAEDGLETANHGEVKGFSVCFQGEDTNIKDECKAHLVKAHIEGNTVIISYSSEIGKEPAAVFYAWSNHPEAANLCSKKGLPASPFKCLLPY